MSGCYSRQLAAQVPRDGNTHALELDLPLEVHERRLHQVGGPGDEVLVLRDERLNGDARDQKSRIP